MTYLNRIVVAVAVVIVVMLAFVWATQRRMIYFPAAHVPSPRALGLERVEEVSFHTPDGLELHGWFFSSPSGRLKASPTYVGAGFSRPVATVLVFNGNAGNRAYRVPLAESLRARGFEVLLIDYRGFGGNRGAASERGLAADSRAARAYLATRSNVDSGRLVYFGESLGAAVAVDLAAEHPPAALVLRSPFTSMTDIGRYHYPFLPVALLLRDRFPSIDVIGRVRSPVLVIAGDRDTIVPLEFSRRLYDAAADPKEFVTIAGADHNDDELLSGAEMVDATVRFIDTHVPKGRS